MKETKAFHGKKKHTKKNKKKIMGSPFKMTPGKGGSAKHTGRGMSERGLISGGPKAHGKPHYDTTEAGRATVYGATQAIPAKIQQRSGASSVRDDVMKKGYDIREGSSGIGEHLNAVYNDRNSVAGEFKRRTGDKTQAKPRTSSYSNVDVQSNASMKDPRSGKDLINTGALGSEKQMNNYGYATRQDVSSTDFAAGRGGSARSRQRKKDSKAVDKKVLSAAKNWEKGEAAISSQSSGMVKPKGPDLNSQLLGGMQQEDPKPVKAAKASSSKNRGNGSPGRKYKPNRSQRLSQKGKLNKKNAARLGKRGR
jgi:hypothetical protein